MKVYIKSFFVSIAITLIAFLCLSVLLSKTSLSEDFLPLGIIFISSISILVGGYFIGKDKKSKGMIYGAIFGLVYMITLYLISSICSLNFSINLQTIFMILAGTLRWNDRRNIGSKFIKKL